MTSESDCESDASIVGVEGSSKKTPVKKPKKAHEAAEKTLKAMKQQWEGKGNKIMEEAINLQELEVKKLKQKYDADMQRYEQDVVERINSVCTTLIKQIAAKEFKIQAEEAKQVIRKKELDVMMHKLDDDDSFESWRDQNKTRLLDEERKTLKDHAEAKAAHKKEEKEKLKAIKDSAATKDAKARMRKRDSGGSSSSSAQ